MSEFKKAYSLPVIFALTLTGIFLSLTPCLQEGLTIKRPGIHALRPPLASTNASLHRDNLEADNELRSLESAIFIIEHGGPLSIVDFVEFDVRYRKDILVNAIEVSPEIRDALNDNFETLFELNFIYFNNIVGKFFQLKEGKRAIEEVRQEYKKWLKDIIPVLIEIQDLLRQASYAEAKAKDARDFICNGFKRQIHNIKAVSSFLMSEEEFEGAKETIDIGEWMGEQVWQTKWQSGLPLRAGGLTPDDRIVINFGQQLPPVYVCGGLLHLAIERFISNGFHAIQQDEETIPDEKEIITINVLPSQHQDGLQIIIENPGGLTEEQLEIDERSGLPSLMTLQKKRRSSAGGIGLPFAVQAIIKIGGKVEVTNVEQDGIPIVRFVITLPAAPAFLNEILEEVWAEFSRKYPGRIDTQTGRPLKNAGACDVMSIIAADILAKRGAEEVIVVTRSFMDFHMWVECILGGRLYIIDASSGMVEENPVHGKIIEISPSFYEDMGENERFVYLGSEDVKFQYAYLRGKEQNLREIEYKVRHRDIKLSVSGRLVDLEKRVKGSYHKLKILNIIRAAI